MPVAQTARKPLRKPSQEDGGAGPAQSPRHTAVLGVVLVFRQQQFLAVLVPMVGIRYVNYFIRI